MVKVGKKLVKYSKALLKRVCRPIKPVVSPLVKRVKLWQVLSLLLVIAITGSLVDGWRVKPQEQASFWPWSSRSHSEMALYWFEVGDEEKALGELEIANKLLILKTKKNLDSLNKAQEKVTQPERIREEIKSWEKVLEERPYFRDVLLRLSILNYQIYEDEKTIEYFNRASYLDPNYVEVLNFRKVIFPMQSLD